MDLNKIKWDAVGAIVYDAYRKQRGVEDKTVPWLQLTPEAQDAWKAAARALVEELAKTINKVVQLIEHVIENPSVMGDLEAEFSKGKKADPGVN